MIRRDRSSLELRSLLAGYADSQKPRHSKKPGKAHPSVDSQGSEATRFTDRQGIRRGLAAGIDVPPIPHRVRRSLCADQ